ncbi:inositol monophosphatase family protein [Myxococcaceae bacterium GXIMD 01537]
MEATHPIIEAVRRACELSRRVREADTGFSSKSDSSPVTLADYGAQALLCRTLALHAPGDAVVAEEGADAFARDVGAEDGAFLLSLLEELLGVPVTREQVVRWLEHGRGPRTPRTWVIDPIDGTLGFVSGRAYAVCVGLLRDGEPAEGIIGAPVSPLDVGGTLFRTEAGGARAEPLAGGPVREVRVSRREEPETVRIVHSFERGAGSKRFEERVQEAAGLQAASTEGYDGMVKYALVAAGAADLFVRSPRGRSPHKLWDHVAGTALVRAAGGVVTGLRGEPVDFTQGTELSNPGLVVSNAVLHARVVAATTRVIETPDA